MGVGEHLISASKRSLSRLGRSNGCYNAARAPVCPTNTIDGARTGAQWHPPSDAVKLNIQPEFALILLRPTHLALPPPMGTSYVFDEPPISISQPIPSPHSISFRLTFQFDEAGEARVVICRARIPRRRILTHPRFVLYLATFLSLFHPALAFLLCSSAFSLSSFSSSAPSCQG